MIKTSKFNFDNWGAIDIRIVAVLLVAIIAIGVWYYSQPENEFPFGTTASEARIAMSYIKEDGSEILIKEGETAQLYQDPGTLIIYATSAKQTRVVGVRWRMEAKISGTAAKGEYKVWATYSVTGWQIGKTVIPCYPTCGAGQKPYRILSKETTKTMPTDVWTTVATHSEYVNTAYMDWHMVGGKPVYYPPIDLSSGWPGYFSILLNGQMWTYNGEVKPSNKVSTPFMSATITVYGEAGTFFIYGRITESKW